MCVHARVCGCEREREVTTGRQSQVISGIITTNHSTSNCKSRTFQNKAVLNLKSSLLLLLEKKKLDCKTSNQ